MTKKQSLKSIMKLIDDPIRSERLEHKWYIEKLKTMRQKPMTVKDLMKVLEKVKDKKTSLVVNLRTPRERYHGYEWWQFEIDCTITKDKKHALVVFQPTKYEGS